MAGIDRRLAFISYAQEDLAFVQAVLAPLLEDCGYASWWADTGIQGGEDFQLRIVERLRAADLFVLVMSPDSQKSEWVRAELHTAFQLGKYVIPLLYRDCDALGFHVRLPPVQMIDVRRSTAQLAATFRRAAAEEEHLVPRVPIRDLTTEFAAMAITLLPWQELNHVRNLARGTTANYYGGRPVRHEVRHLCDVGWCRRKPGRRVGELEKAHVLDLAEIVELTEIGRELSRYVQ